MASRRNRAVVVGLSTALWLGGCGGQSGGGFGINGQAGAAELGPTGLATAYLSGREALESGDISAAAEQFATALQADPENVELRRQLFLLHMAAGEISLAGDVAGSLQDYVNAPDETALLLGVQAFVRGNLDEAENHFAAIQRQGVNSLLLPFLDVWLVFAKGDEEAAISSLGEENDTSGLTLVRSYHRASMLLLNGAHDEALSLLAEIVPEDEPVPNRLLLQRVAALVTNGETAVAERVLDRQAEVDGENIVRVAAQEIIEAGRVPDAPIASPAEGMADALLSLARAVSDQSGGAQALLFGRLAAYLAPGAADIDIFLAELLTADEHHEAALSVLSDRGDDNIYGYEAHLLEARILRQLERYDEAAQVLESLAEARPLRSDALTALGNMHSGNRDYEEASVALSRAIDRIAEPQDYHWRLFYSRGISYERTDRWPLAEADFQQALELEAEQPFVLNYLGYSWVDQGLNLDEAKAMLRRAVELRPEDGFIVDSLGWAHYRLGEYEEAVTHLERAIELEPGDPVINDHLGDAYWRVGRLREARFQWERAKIFDPEEDELAKIEIKLREGLDAVAGDRG